jgi:hypothetical protein
MALKITLEEPAIFEKLSDTKSYKKKYDERIQTRNDLNRDKSYKKKYDERIQTRNDLNRNDNQNYKIYIKLHIFRANIDN